MRGVGGDTCARMSGGCTSGETAGKITLRVVQSCQQY